MLFNGVIMIKSSKSSVNSGLSLMLGCCLSIMLFLVLLVICNVTSSYGGNCILYCVLHLFDGPLFALCVLDLFMEDGAPFIVLYFKEYLGQLSILEFPVLKGFRQCFHY